MVKVMGRRKTGQAGRVALAAGLTMLVLQLAVLAEVVAQTPPPVNLQPQEPPGVGPMVQRLLNWLYWGAWVAVFGVGIYGAIQWMLGDAEKGKKYIGGAIIGAIILAAITAIIPALVGG